MKMKSVMWLALAVAGLGAFAWFVDRDSPGTEQRRKAADKLLSLEPEEIQRVVVSSATADLVLERSPAEFVNDKQQGDLAEAETEWRWWLRTPITAHADEGKIARLLETLTDLDRSRRLQEVELTDYGLDHPDWTLRFETDGRVAELQVGLALPGLRQVAVSLDGTTVDLVPDSWLSQLPPDAEGWRSKRLFWQQRDDIKGFVITGHDEVVLKRTPDDAFRLTKPFEDLADRSLVDSLIGTVSGLTAESYPSAEESASVDQSVIEQQEGGGLRIETMNGEPWNATLLGGNRVLVNGEAVRLETASLLEIMQREAAQWRSPSWSPFSGYEVDRAVLIDADGEIRLERVEGDWKRDGLPIGFAAATDVLYAMSEAKAASFEAVAGPASASLAQEPLLEVTLTATAQERELALYQGLNELIGSCLAMVDDRPVALRLSRESCDNVLAAVDTLRQAAAIGATESAEEGSG